MDKKFIKLDNEKRRLLIFNVASCVFFLLSIVLFLFSKHFTEKTINVFFWILISISIIYPILLTILIIKYKIDVQKALKSKYNFNREAQKSNIEVIFKDCIMQEVEFRNDGFVLNGDLVSYDEVNLEYTIYGDNIMMHIYLKSLEDTNPLLIFIVTEDLYFCVKKFGLNIESLDKEIDMLNMNYKR